MGLLKIITDTLATFGKRTSIAGLNNAANRMSYIRRFIWLIIFFALLALTIQAFVNTVYDYLSYPILTTVNITRKPNLPFPAITVCNINRIHCMNLIEAKLRADKQYEDSASEENNKTLTTLNALVNLTVCLPQACNFIGQILTPIREGELGGKKDLAILSFADLGCISLPFNKLRDCYYVKTIEEDTLELNNTEIYKRSLRAQKELECELRHACLYKPPPDTPAPLLRKFKPPKSCKPDEIYKPDKERGKYFTTFYNTNPVIAEEAKFFNLYFELPRDVQRDIGHKFESHTNDIYGLKIEKRGFVLSCFYRGESCSNKNASWVSINLPRYGNCYTFNSMSRRFNKLKATSLTGEANGVSMSFYIDQDNYIISRLSEKAGLRIIIHEPGNVPLPDEDGIDIQPSTSTSIGIQKSDIVRLPSPYVSKCFSHWNQTSYENFTQNYPVYTITVCQKMCLQLQLMERCGCVIPYITELTGTEGIKICNIKPSANKDSDFYCYQNFLETFKSKIKRCGCNVSCRKVNYAFQSTISTWPAEHFWEGLAVHLGLIDAKLTPLPTNLKPKFEDRIRKDFAKVDIYYQTLSVKVTEEIAKYSNESFVSGLGGTMSLYLGIAIIMVFEILELIYDIISNVGVYIFRGETNTKRTAIQAIK